MGPRLIRALVRALLAVFYRRVDVVGLEHVPAAGPLLVAGNHQNGLVDPILLIATMPRTLRSGVTTASRSVSRPILQVPTG